MSKLGLLLLSASLLQAAGLCTSACTQGGHTSSCKDRITWAKDNVKDKTGTAIGLCPAITLVDDDCHGQCSCSDDDFGAHCGPAPAPPAPAPTPPAPTPTPPSPDPSGKFCGAVSSDNACKPCTQESDCGIPHPMGPSCKTGKDSGCTPPPPLPPPAKDGFCQGGSSTNACKPCATEVDCGHVGIGQFSCWQSLDPNCIPSTCNSTCNQGGHASSCKDRINWAKDNMKDKTGQPIGVCAAITLVNDDCKDQCLCKDKDFAEDCTPHIGWCKKSSTQNACKGCNSEDDCGNDGLTTEFFCQKAKDPTCSGPGPAPGPAAGTCEKSAPSNGCKDCNTEGDCGNNDPSPSKFFCQKAKDPACSGPGPSPTGAGWCTKESPTGSCGHCSTESDCGNSQPGKYFCQAAKAWNCPMDDIVV